MIKIKNISSKDQPKIDKFLKDFFEKEDISAIIECSSGKIIYSKLKTTTVPIAERRQDVIRDIRNNALSPTYEIPHYNSNVTRLQSAYYLIAIPKNKKCTECGIKTPVDCYGAVDYECNDAKKNYVCEKCCSKSKAVVKSVSFKPQPLDKSTIINIDNFFITEDSVKLGEDLFALFIEFETKRTTIIRYEVNNVFKCETCDLHTPKPDKIVRDHLIDKEYCLEHAGPSIERAKEYIKNIQTGLQKYIDINYQDKGCKDCTNKLKCLTKGV